MSGARSRKERIACFAAASRVGLTSSARIEPETSTTSTTLARSFGVFTVDGRPRERDAERRERQRAASAAGRWRRQARAPPATLASTSRFV